MKLFKQSKPILGIPVLGILLVLIEAFISNQPLQITRGRDFSVIVIPDPQYYASLYPRFYRDQMRWVVRNRAAYNIAFVASLGDNVDDLSIPRQWAVAKSAYDLLDGAGIPYGIAAGNHDGAPANTGNFNDTFGETRFRRKASYGGHYGNDNDNSFAIFEAEGLKFISLFIEYDDDMTDASHPVLAWANQVLQTNPERRAMVISHNMLEGGTSNTFSRQGRAIYEALKGNPNLFLIMGGHLDVTARRFDTYEGRVVYTLRSDYQFVDNQKSGYLRILRFSPENNRISVSTYSPVWDQFYPDEEGNDHNFSLPYDMGGGNEEMIGKVDSAAIDSESILHDQGADSREEGVPEP